MSTLQVTGDGCQMLCCGQPFWHQGYKQKGQRATRLTAASLKLREETEMQVGEGGRSRSTDTKGDAVI